MWVDDEDDDEDDDDDVDDDGDDKIGGCDLISIDMAGFSVSLRPQVCKSVPSIR